MKAVMMSIKPKWVAKILNGNKTIEIRKRFPKDYVGWVYIYCTKEKPRAILTDKGVVVANTLTVGGNSQYKSGYSLSGRVVARFWCDKVERLYEYQVDGYGSDYEIASDTLEQEELLKECCLTYDQLSDYLGDINNGYALSITKLEIFDKPKEISGFKHDCYHHYTMVGYTSLDPLTRAPQSWCYVEVLL